MESKFKDYLDSLFKNLKKTEEVCELKNELLNDLILESNNLLEEYDDEDYVFDICINNLGNINILLKEYKKDYSKLNKKIELPKYMLGEELVNSISHGFGVILSITALIFLILKQNNGIELFSVLVYSISSTILYLTSCLYHSLKRNNAKRVFRIIDHCSIFILISGTYTPIVLLKLPSPISYIIFSIVWLIAILGIVINSIDIKKYKNISMILYLLSGWCIIFSFKSLWNNLSHVGIIYTLVGGIIYTIGAVLYGIGKKKKYMHSIFHIFCIIASIFFFITIYFYVL